MDPPRRRLIWLTSRADGWICFGSSVRGPHISILLLILLLILLVGALSSWPYSRTWGYYPSGGVGTILIIILILLFLGWI